MKPIPFICLLILFATPALAQYDTNAYRNEIHKEIKSLEETLLTVKKKSLELEKESLRKDTLIEALRRKRVEVTTNLSLTEQTYRDMQYAGKELGGLIKDYQKQQKDINALINAKPNKLTKTEREQYRKDLADISKSLSDAKSHNDTLQKDMKRVITRIEERKKELDWSGKEAERIKENRKTMQSGLDKAAQLIAEIEKEIESLKHQLLDK